MHKYMKIGKRNGKRKKKRVFPSSWAKGDFGPAERGRACVRAGRWPSQPTEGRNGAGERRGHGPTCHSEEGEGNDIGGKGRSAAMRTGHR
jgi:hypothetical protein